MAAPRWRGRWQLRRWTPAAFSGTLLALWSPLLAAWQVSDATGASVATPRSDKAPRVRVAVGGAGREHDDTRLRADAALDARVSMEVHAKPLSKVVAELGREARVDLQVEKALGPRRFTVVMRERPVRDVMLRLRDALSHGEEPPDSVEWRPVDGEKAYELTTTSRGRRNERDAADMPVRTLLRWLGDLRRCAAGTMSDAELRDTDCPVLSNLLRMDETERRELVPVVEALAGATEAQLAQVLARGSAEPAPGGLGTDPAPRLHLARAPMVGGFDLTIDTDPSGRNQIGFVFDTMGIGAPDAETQRRENERDARSGKPCTLPAGVGESMDGTPGGSLEAALRRWTDVTGRHLVAEVFLKTVDTLPGMSGTPDQLVTQLCRAFSCDWRSIGGTTVMWSKTWAQDRVGDVDCDKVGRWQVARQRLGELRLIDGLKVVSLQDPQVETMARWLSCSTLGVPSSVAILRVLGSLTPSDRRAAFGPRGVRPSRLLRDGPVHIAAALRQEPVWPVWVQAERTPVPGRSDCDRVVVTVGDAQGGSLFRASIAVAREEKR